MTFLEAAIEILKRERQPLHYKQLTEIALAKNLLTVVGRTPELTMQQRLNDALKKSDPGQLLTREKPGVYGLRYYPPPSPTPEPVAAAAAPAAAEGEGATAKEGGAADDRKRGRRRRGRGGRHADGAEATAAPAPAARPPRREEDAAAIARRGAAATPAPSEAAEERRFDETTVAEGEVTSIVGETVTGMVEAAPEAPGSDRELATARTDGEPAPERTDETLLDDDDEVDAPAGPLIAPAFGTEEIVRGEDHRPVFEGRPHRGGREERGRDRHRGRPDRPDRAARPDRPAQDRPGHQPRPSHGPGPGGGHGEQRQQTHGPTRGGEARPVENRPPVGGEQRPAERVEAQRPVEGGRRSLVDASVDILRGGDGRPLHIRQLVDLAIKKRLLRGDPPELWRLTRVALLAEQRAREAAGLRPRVRAVGGGHYVLADRKLDNDLVQLERTVAADATRLTELSHAALGRRLARLAAPAFEALTRTLLERMKVIDVELVKRGEGVAYFGGLATAGGKRIKLLIGIRPGEAALGRNAVAELRGGLKARGFEEGLLLSAGRAGPDAHAELTAAPGAVTLCDGEALVRACAVEGLGVVRRSLTVDLLDLELLAELSD